MKNKGFSTLELMIAFALMSLVFGGVILSYFGSSYFAIASETSNEALYKAKTRLEELRAIVKKDFRLASSSPTTGVSDISSCLKFVEVSTEWQVGGYPTTSISLFSMFTDPNEALQVGSDCELIPLKGSGLTASSTFPSDIVGTPKTLDVFENLLYVGTTVSPYLEVLNSKEAVTFTNGFALLESINAIDVAKSPSTGRIYAYLAMASTTAQLAIVDVTDRANPMLMSQIGLPGVAGTSAHGWRIAYYGDYIYISVRNSQGPEFHVFEVSDPANPYATGALELTTSLYSLAVREQRIGEVSRRFVFATGTHDTREVRVIEVTDPTQPTTIKTIDLPEVGCALSDSPDGRMIFISGNTLYVGRDHSATSCPELGDLYALDISNPVQPSIVSSVVAGGSILGLHASGDFLYALISSQASPGGVERLLDRGGDSFYIARNTSKELKVYEIGSDQSLDLRLTYPIPNLDIQVLQNQ